MTIPTDQGQGIAMVHVYRPDGSRHFSLFAVVGDHRVEAVVTVDGQGTVREELPRTPSAAKFRTGFTPDLALDYVVLIAVTGDIESWTLTGWGVSLRHAGNDTAFYNVGDLPRGSQVMVAAGDAAADVAVGAALDIEVRDHLVGGFVFGLTQAHAGTAEVRGPTRTWVCQCVIADLAGPKSAGPGQYEFALEGAGAMVTRKPIATFVDVPFP